MQIDHKIAQLLVSRACHDLAGSISAVSNGAELLSESPEMMDEQALDVIAMSAHQSASRLAFFRMAFGLGGGESDTVTTDDLKMILMNFLEGGRLSVIWGSDNRRITLMQGKMLMNVCLVCAESLPRGGTLDVNITDIGTKLGFAVRAVGDGAAFRPGIEQAFDLNCDPNDLSARTVHAHFSVILAQSLGAEIEYGRDGEDEIRFAALI